MKKYLVLNCRKKLTTENYKLYEKSRSIHANLCEKTESIVYNTQKPNG
jgi:hypothetical protein